MTTSPTAEAFGAVLAADTPAARDTAMADAQAVASWPQNYPQGAGASLLARDPEYLAAFQAANASETLMGRAAATAAMEARALALHTGEGASEAPAQLPPGMEPATSLHELRVPSEILPQVADETGLHQIRVGAMEAGVPAAYFAQAMANGAGNRHLLDDAGAFENSVKTMRQSVLSQHGPEAGQALLRDAAKYIDSLEAHIGRDACDLLALDRWAVESAANLWRSGARPRAKASF